MEKELKKIKKQNIILQKDEINIRVTSIFSDKGQSFQKVMEDIIKKGISR